jgi:hypothetical protein
LCPSEVAPYRCGSHSEGARSLTRYRANDLAYVESGHIALPPGDRSVWERNTLRDDWLKLRNPGAPAVRRGPRKTGADNRFMNSVRVPGPGLPLSGEFVHAGSAAWPLKLPNRVLGRCHPLVESQWAEQSNELASAHVSVRDCTLPVVVERHATLCIQQKLTADGRDGFILVDFGFVQALSYGPRTSPNSTETRASDP